MNLFEIADSHVAALNYALEGLPKAKIPCAYLLGKL